MSMRVARAATRIRPSAFRLPLQRRAYADAVSDKIKLTLALPHQVRAPQPKIGRASCQRGLVPSISYHQLTLHPLQSIYKSTDVCVPLRRHTSGVLPLHIDLGSS